MSVTKTFLDSLATFAEIALKTSRNSSDTTDKFGTFLFAAFKFGKSKILLSSENSKSTSNFIAKLQPSIEDCFENLVDDFHHNDITTYLIYRSGLEFIFSLTEAGQIEVDLKSERVIDIVEELDDKISSYWKAPADPFGATPHSIDLNGVPESHTWWKE